MELGLDNKIVVVTGAGRGIGLAIARALASEGARVVGAARTVTPELRDVAAVTVEVDVATPDGPRRMIDRALDLDGGIDVLINNVGTFQARTAGFADVTDADWEATLQTNLLSAVRAIRAALPSLIERRGTIVNVSSARARAPQPPVVDYAAAKAALTNLGKTLAFELAPHGVRVNTVSPGPTRTDAWERPGGVGATLAAASGTAHERFLAEFPANAGLATGRLTEPDEVAAVALLLASDRAANATGVDYAIDGGQIKTI
jgi:putative oxidoreductase